MSTAQKRSAVMRGVKRAGTKLEARFGEILKTSGFGEFELQAADLSGTPDFVYRPQSLAIFVDSCFWHGCPDHARVPKSNVDYWTTKMEKNRERDRRQTQDLEAQGWRAERFWEHEMKDERVVIGRLADIFEEYRGRTVD